jgi:hypothetical protein
MTYPALEVGPRRRFGRGVRSALPVVVGLAGALALFAFVMTPGASAAQSDVSLPLDNVDALFEGSSEGSVEGLSASDGLLEFGFYAPAEEAHAYHGTTAARVALLDFGGDAVWSTALSAQTVVDEGNDLGFRLTRLFYDVRTGVDWRLGPGFLRLHWIHRCSHGVDSALEGRILIRNGLDVSYRWNEEGKFGRLEVDLLGHVTVLGQNDDLANHNRGLVSGRVQWSHAAGNRTRLLVGAGLGAMVVARGEDWEYTLSESATDPRVEWLPALVIGGRFEGVGSKMTLLYATERIVDDGIGLTSRPRNLHAIRLGFEL